MAHVASEETPHVHSDREGLDCDAAARLLSSLNAPERDHPPHEGYAPLGYTIARRIGGGGQAEVFLAFRDGSERPVALKVFRSPLGASDEASRAWRELDLLADLRLACLPRLLDFGEHAGRLFLATEHVAGEDLTRYCDSRSLSRHDRARLLAFVCDAVQSLHERAVIHRDIKPSNILIDARGEPTLIDLGLAAAVTDATLTATGAPMGTLAFMAPEQARGDRAELSTRTDVFGLGATAYALLLGATAHDTSGPIVESLRAIADRQPRDPSALDPTCDAALAAVLRKAVARAPDHRYPSAAEFGADLRRWAAGEPVSAQPPGAWRRLSGWIGRHPALATAALCALMFASSTAATVLTSRRLQRAPGSVVCDGSTGSVFSISGAPIRSWNGALQLERLSGPDGRELLAVMLGATADAPEGPGLHIHAFRPGLPRLWSAGARDIEPSLLNGAAAGLCAPAFVRAQEVDPIEPGEELIVVSWQSGRSACLVEVRSASGETLAEVWHDGRIHDVLRCETESGGVLLMAGANSERPWSALAGGASVFEDSATQNASPPCVFAAPYERGMTRVVESGSAALWYAMIGEMDVASRLDIDGLRLTPHAGRRPTLAVRLRGDPAPASLTIDPLTGASEAALSDGWKQRAGAPASEALLLRPFPAPVE